MAVKDANYIYIPSQERIVNVSNYMINREHTSSRADGLLDSRTSVQPNACVSDTFRYGADGSLADGVEASADFEMKNVSWSDEIYTVSDLLSLRYPIIVRVIKGYYGNDDQQLTDGQILQVYMSYDQLRVRATDSRDRTLTIPINCPLSVRPLSGSHRSGHAQALPDLLGDISLPVNIEVTGVNRKNSFTTSMNHVASNLTDSHLMLREISRQNFLVANAITKGWLDQSRFVIIPEQLKLTFRMATGIRTATMEEWKDVCGMYSRAARHLKFHLIGGHEDVIYDDWIGQTKPATFERSQGIDTDRGEGEEVKDNESDSDSTPKRSQCRLLWQQTPLTHGSLPSLPVALRNSSTASDPRPQSTTSGSVTPSHVSTESLQPCKSTESLLPRSATDCGAVVKETGGKRKSNMPSRLLRRKAEPKKQGSGSATVPATEFELASDIRETSVASKTSESVLRYASMSRSSAPIINSVPVSRLSEHDDTCNVDSAFDSVFDEPSRKDTIKSNTDSSEYRESTIPLRPESSPRRQERMSPNNPKNVSLNDVTSMSLDDVKKKWLKNDYRSNLHGSSDDAVLDYRSADGHVWSPVYWSSDLCITSSSELEITRMKGMTSQTPSATVPRDLSAYHDVATRQQLSPKCHSAPIKDSSRIRSTDILHSTQSLFSFTSTDLSAKHNESPGDDRVTQGLKNLSSEEYGVPIVGIYKDAVHFRRISYEHSHNADPNSRLYTSYSSTDCNIATGSDYSNPKRLGVSRSRKLSNGLVKMRLDQNGTVLSIGSDAIDDGYITKGNSMTSSLETLNARRSLQAGRESACYI